MFKYRIAPAIVVLLLLCSCQDTKLNNKDADTTINSAPTEHTDALYHRVTHQNYGSLLKKLDANGIKDRDTLCLNVSDELEIRITRGQGLDFTYNILLQTFNKPTKHIVDYLYVYSSDQQHTYLLETAFNDKLQFKSHLELYKDIDKSSKEVIESSYQILPDGHILQLHEQNSAKLTVEPDVKATESKRPFEKLGTELKLPLSFDDKSIQRIEQEARNKGNRLSDSLLTRFFVQPKNYARHTFYGIENRFVLLGHLSINATIKGLVIEKIVGNRSKEVVLSIYSTDRDIFWGELIVYKKDNIPYKEMTQDKYITNFKSFIDTNYKMTQSEIVIRALWEPERHREYVKFITDSAYELMQNGEIRKIKSNRLSPVFF